MWQGRSIILALKTPELFPDGYCLSDFKIDEQLRETIFKEDWEKVDLKFREYVKPGGVFFNFLKTFHEFSSIEFIISIRDARNEWEEDGIWHDDGSRVFAFSLSITLTPEEIEGGHLEIRRKDTEELIASIPTPAFGSVILFLTGVHGFEHRTRQVLKSRRLIIAGWCSD